MPREFGEVVFTLVDLKVGTYNIVSDALGAAVDLPEAQMLEITINADTDMIKAEGKRTHSLTVITEAAFKLSSAGIPWDALVVMTGVSSSESLTTPNQVRRSRLSAGGRGFPYFWVAGKMIDEVTGDKHVGLAVCKLNTFPAWKIEQNKFVIPEVDGVAQQRDGGYLLYSLDHETEANIVPADLFS